MPEEAEMWKAVSAASELATVVEITTRQLHPEASENLRRLVYLVAAVALAKRGKIPRAVFDDVVDGLWERVETTEKRMQ